MSIYSTKRAHSPSPSSDHKRLRQAESPKKSVQFLIMSDTHGANLPSTLPACDVLLHCGDITEDGSPESIIKALEDMGKVPAELKLVIAGNHEISLDETYYLEEGGKEEDVNVAKSLVTDHPTSLASKGGIAFLMEGTPKFLLASGASFSIYASPYTPAYGASGFQYPTNEDRYNPPTISPPWAQNVGTETSRIPEGVDIVMTHGPPKYILDSTEDGRSAGCEHLRRAIERVKPQMVCFGHIHGGYGAQRIEFGGEVSVKDESDSIIPLAKEWVGKNQAKRKGFASLPPGSLDDYRSSKQTLCINAAIEGAKGQLENAPWVVDLEL
ncbi:hypothetical protein NX059_005781 [Plenodomus lindquistii]|nr:hypothetical protein NX059_005781 [Plenodomus lindquistii]